MKKKLLSLVLAGAMVASTSVSAFADTKLTFQESQTGEADVTITGEVTNDTGTTLPGTLNVTVPTDASFAVTQGGVFTAPKIKITNHSTKDIDVFAYEFIDVDGPEQGINIVGKGETSTRNRKEISLNISGGEGVAYLKSEGTAGKKGVYKKPDLTGDAENSDGIKIASIAGNGTVGELTLDGEAGTGTTTDAANNKFTLKLKIKKKA